MDTWHRAIFGGNCDENSYLPAGFLRWRIKFAQDKKWNSFYIVSLYIKQTVCTYVPFSRQTNLHQILHRPTDQLREGSYLINLENFTQKPQFFPFRSKKSHRVGSKNTRVKGRSAPYLLRVKSMLGSG